jgi:flagellar basal-body rod protein FlgF/flagellar basal-body rod protein FlgG
MDSGYYAASAGLAAQMQALELVAHNLANLGTAGYRGEQATFRSLLTGSGAVSTNALNIAINDYGVLGGSRLDMSPGSLVATGNPLDLGMGGRGFFTVRSGALTLYTRNGSFHLTPTRQLVTAEGDAVLAEQGPISVPVTLPEGKVAVSSDGTLSVDGAVVAKLRLAEFSPQTSLTAVGNSLYSAPAGSALPAADSTVHQAMLENSNVNAAMSVIQMMTVQRNAEMLQRALGAFDSQLNQTAAQDLPRVGA